MVTTRLGRTPFLPTCYLLRQRHSFLDFPPPARISQQSALARNCSMHRCIEWKAFKLEKVNGVALEEYAMDEKDSDDSVTSWIVGEEG